MEQRDVVDIGEAPSEVLPVSVEKIMKQHENEREQMKRMGPLVPIDGDTSADHKETTTNALPIPLRRNRYNHTSLFDTSPISDSGMECDLQTTQSQHVDAQRKSSLKSESSERGTKHVSYGTIETKYTKNEECQTESDIDDTRHIGVLENKIDMLMTKMDTILNKFK